MTLPTKDNAAVLSKAAACHRWISGVLFLVLFFLCSPAFGSSYQKRAQARAAFQKAEKLRAELQARPLSERRLADYQAVIRLYERVALLAPTIAVADDSVAAEARLLAEMGRQFRERAALERAAERYRFLVKQYPHSKFVAQAGPALKALEKISLEPASERATSLESGGAVGAGSPGKMTQVTHIRNWATGSYTRVVIELDGPAEYEAGRIANPDRIFFDLHGVRLSPEVRRQNLQGDDGLLKRIRIAQNQIGIARVVLEVGPVRDYSAFILPNPYRLVVDINGSGAPPRQEPASASVARPAAPETAAVAPIRSPAGSLKKTSEPPPEKPEPETIVASTTAPTSKPVFERVPQPAPAASPKAKESVARDVPIKEAPASREAPPRETASKEPAKETAAKETAAKEPAAAVAPPRVARPTSSGQRSLTRALGLKIGKIVIDAGHGGHDTGTIGPTGLMEKDLVLDVARRLGGLVEDRLGGEVVYTRQEDVFIPLETRTAIANQKQADLFVSIHANSSRDAGARGIETYYLNFTTAQDALEVAARENAVSEKSVHELQDLVKKITMKEKLEESREFAAEVQRSLHTTMSRGNLGLRNRGVKKAPFVVLIGANMPSILAEVSFVSNPTDERLLRKAEYRQKVAEALYRGIQRYANSLAGVKVAHSTLAE